MPALVVQVQGQVVSSNLGEYREAALALIESVNTDLQTDSDFAHAKDAVKWAAEVESKVQQAKEDAINQTADIAQLLDVLTEVGETARNKRLELSRIIKQRDTELKNQMVQAASNAYLSKANDLSQSLGQYAIYASPAPVDFAEPMKGKRSLETMQKAVDAALKSALEVHTKRCAALSAGAAIVDQVGHKHLYTVTEELLTMHPTQLHLHLTGIVNQHLEMERQRQELERQKAELAAKEAMDRQLAQERQEAERQLSAERERLAAEMARSTQPPVETVAPPIAVPPVAAPPVSALPAVDASQPDSKERQGQVNNSIVLALMQYGLNQEQGRDVVRAILRGQIPNVSIHY